MKPPMPPILLAGPSWLSDIPRDQRERLRPLTTHGGKMRARLHSAGVRCLIAGLTPFAATLVGWATAWVEEPGVVLLGVFVRPDLRRRGIGAVLLAAIRHEARRYWPTAALRMHLPKTKAARALYVAGLERTP